MTLSVVDDARTWATRDSPPSNSGTFRPGIEPRGPSAEGWGVDKLGFSFPISDCDRHRDVWFRHRRQAPREREYRLVDWTEVLLDFEVPLTLEVFKVPQTNQYWVRAEFNPAKLVDPYGVGLCAPNDLPYAVIAAWDSLGSLVSPSCDIWDARIKRLDVARDFLDVGDCSTYLNGWLMVPAAHSTRWRIEHEAKTGRAQTIYKGTKTSGLIRGYDKYAQSDKAEPGTFRFEVEAYSPWCRRYGGIECVDDLSTHSVHQLLLNRWKWSGCASPVSGPSAFLSKVQALTDPDGKPWKDGRKLTYFGYQVSRAMGSSMEVSKSTKAEYNKVLLRTGVPVLSDLAAPEGSRPQLRLDFETGREVEDAA